MTFIFDTDATTCLRRSSRIPWLALALALACVSPVDAQQEPQDVVVRGLERTRRETVLELLPRAPPAVYSDAELIELERRLANLGVFDLVEVDRRADAVEIRVREKWTLIPLVDFATGSTWEDTYVAASVVEYNFLGRAMQLGGSVWHEERGWNVELGLIEHAYHPARGSLGGLLEYTSSELRFADREEAWGRLGGGLQFQWQAPAPHDSAWSYRIRTGYAYEHNVDPATQYAPPHGHELSGELAVTWESWRWDDLAPRGLRLELSLSPGIFMTQREPQARMAAVAYGLFATPLTDLLVLLGQLTATAMNRGNANFSTAIGSVSDVRGLEDGVYHAWLAGVLNLELRQAVRIAERWAVQLVVFGDLAAFEQVDPRGERGERVWASSAGAGIRVVPTFLAALVLRVDVARAFAPDEGFFWQWALSQYF